MQRTLVCVTPESRGCMQVDKGTKDYLRNLLLENPRKAATEFGIEQLAYFDRLRPPPATLCATVPSPNVRPTRRPEPPYVNPPSSPSALSVSFVTRLRALSRLSALLP